ncbi:hypothetical protein MOKP125_21240 [Mycobacterium avium subsp. hominissuis]
MAGAGPTLTAVTERDDTCTAVFRQPATDPGVARFKMAQPTSNAFAPPRVLNGVDVETVC